MSTDHFINFDGCWNFRDIGGYSTRDGRSVHKNRLYRSDSLQWMTPKDAAKARGELEIAQVIDLRSSDEVERFGKGPITDHSVRYQHLPVAESIDYKKLLGTSPIYTGLRIPYIHILNRGKDQIASALTTLSRPDGYPVVFFCMAGTDRTGILAAVVLSLLDVNDKDIIIDFMLTNENVPRMIDRYRGMPFYSWIFETYPDDVCYIQPEMMQVFLDEVRREYGSMRDYTLGSGVSAEVLGNLESNYLTDG